MDKKWINKWLRQNITLPFFVAMIDQQGLSGNHADNVFLSFRNAGSLQRSMLTFCARCKKMADERAFWVFLNASSIAFLGGLGLHRLSFKKPLEVNQVFKSGIIPCQPNTESTWGESDHTQFSSSGSMTIAAARSFQPEAASWVSIFFSSSILVFSSCPHPSWSSTIKAWLY